MTDIVKPGWREIQLFYHFDPELVNKLKAHCETVPHPTHPHICYVKETDYQTLIGVMGTASFFLSEDLGLDPETIED